MKIKNISEKVQLLIYMRDTVKIGETLLAVYAFWWSQCGHVKMAIHDRATTGPSIECMIGAPHLRGGRCYEWT